MHRVAIGVPSLDSWNADFGVALARMLIFCGRQPFAGAQIDLGLFYERGSILPTNRNKLVRQAIEHKFEHLLFLDCDMDFPPDALHRLLAHGKEVVAANYMRRKLGADPVAVADGRPVVSGPDRHGIEAVEGVGTGLMLIRISVFGRVAPPAFAFEALPNNPFEFHGEDYYFCRKLRAAGIPIHIDHDLSREVAHVGSFHYRMSHAGGGAKPA